MAGERAREGFRTVSVGLVIAALVVVGVVGLVLGAGPAASIPPDVPLAGGDLYFTTFAPPSVQRVPFKVVGTNFDLGEPALVARLPGADGLLFGPDGSLLVGGSGKKTIERVDVSTGSMRPVPTAPGVPAFHLSVNLTGTELFTSAQPGPLSMSRIAPDGAVSPGQPWPLYGANTKITAIGFAPNGTVLYTTGDDAGRGDVGVLDLATHTTRRLFTDVPFARGITYDPYTNSFIVIGGDEIVQLSASNPAQLLSELTVSGMNFDQGAVDGRGDAFLASNTGSLVFVDYAATRRVGNTANHVVVSKLVTNLDDVAPLTGPGAKPVPTLAVWWHRGGLGALLLAILLAAAAFGGPANRWVRDRRATRRSQLPRWDRRRQAGLARTQTLPRG